MVEGSLIKSQRKEAEPLSKRDGVLTFNFHSRRDLFGSSIAFVRVLERVCILLGLSEIGIFYIYFRVRRSWKLTSCFLFREKDLNLADLVLTFIIKTQGCCLMKSDNWCYKNLISCALR